VSVTCGLGPTAAANLRMIADGDVATTLFGTGLESTSVLSAAWTGVARAAAATPPASRAMHQRTAECDDDRIEFFKVHQR
jgi:hypothetical protein